MTKYETERRLRETADRMQRLRQKDAQMGLATAESVEQCRRQHAALLRCLAEWNGGRPSLVVIRGGKSGGPPATPAPSSSA